ncbi:hydroxyacid dehydrogenase [Alsobacter sp. R-9]
MADIVITEFMDDASVETLKARYETLYDPNLVDKRDALMAAVRDCRALVVRNRTQVRGELLDACAALEVVGRLGVGLDNIDVEACRARNIPVFPATGANDVSVAEYVIASAMLLLRGAFRSTASVADGRWPRAALINGREISGKTMGLVGFGSIARETAKRAVALGMTVVAHDPFVDDNDPAWAALGVSPVSLDTVMTTGDVVSLHVPLTEETRGMIDAMALDLMKNDAILVNAARGGIVDEEALAVALRNRTIGGAVLDVFEDEPLKAEAGYIFVDCPNLILTPHIAGVTAESNVRVSAVTAQNVLRVLDGA